MLVQVDHEELMALVNEVQRLRANCPYSTAWLDRVTELRKEVAALEADKAASTKFCNEIEVLVEQNRDLTKHNRGLLAELENQDKQLTGFSMAGHSMAAIVKQIVQVNGKNLNKVLKADMERALSAWNKRWEFSS